MQLIVHHLLDEPLVLPINYHHIMQSVIFHSLKLNTEYSKFLHDVGYTNERRNYKLFTFGPINGKYTIKGKNIVFHDEISYEIRSVDSNMISSLYQSISANGIVYLDRQYKNVNAELCDVQVESEELRIRMISPICIYSTEEESKRTIYYHPGDDKFISGVNANFKRKYYAYTGIEADSDIEIMLERLCQKDKYVTNYKGVYINAWKGIYTLRGKRKYLDFLYQTGLGSKNSQGFGMFKIIN